MIPAPLVVDGPQGVRDSREGTRRAAGHDGLGHRTA